VSTPEHASARVMSPTTRTPDGSADRADESRTEVSSQPPAGPDPHETDESKAERERSEARAMESMMWTVIGHMGAALLVYGGIGYLLGRWLGHPILLLFGLLFGMVVSLAYTIWVANRAGKQR
jgi:F0F1-type ATP synthase assembly protein I